MRWYQTLTPSQRRIILGLGSALLLVLGLLAWTVWLSLQQEPPVSPLPTSTLSPSVLSTPTLRPTLTPSPTPTPAFDMTEAGGIANAMADARGVLARWGTPLTLVDVNELSSSLYRYYQSYPPIPLRERSTLEALDVWFWERAVRANVFAQARKTAAIYIPEEAQIYARRDWTGDADTIRTQLAYGYARALPDQYGDLPSLIEDASTLDQRLALESIAQGDALFALWRYAGVDPNSQRAQALMDHVTVATSPTWRPDDPLLRDISGLPLRIGAAFMTALYAEGRLAALDDAIRRPPRSTEQILHPERYVAGDEPIVLDPLEPALGQDWALVHTETVGEAMMGLVLLEWSNGTVGPEAIEGWGGDLLQVWEDSEGAQVALWHIAWDSGDAASHFYAQALTLLPDRVSGVIQDRTAPAGLPQGRWWASRQEAAFLTRDAEHIWLIWGDDAVAVRALAANLNARLPDPWSDIRTLYLYD